RRPPTIRRLAAANNEGEIFEDMSDPIEITPARSPVVGRIRPPGSKSITNRALLCAALADGASMLRAAIAREDTRVTSQSLRRLGLTIEEKSGGTELLLRGCGGTIPVASADLYVANSGTSMRFLAALVALGNGEFRLEGVPRMRERPMKDLIDGLQQLGV